MLFLSTTDSGSFLNRFSQDLQLIDMELPIAAINVAASMYPDGSLPNTIIPLLIILLQLCSCVLHRWPSLELPLYMQQLLSQSCS